jgi:predicted CopG family antitoxin
VRRSSAMMSRMKSEGRSFSVVIIKGKAIGERADRQL